MVSPNLSDLGDEFNDMVEERDWMGYIALAGAGALGGVLAEMFHDRVAPRLNQPAEPTTSQGLLGSFGIKGAAAVLLAFLSVRASGSMAMALAILAIGATIDAGVDLIEAGDRLRGGTTTAQRRSQSGRSQSRRQAPRRRAQPAQSSRTRRTSSSGSSGSSSTPSSSSSTSRRASV